MGIKKRLYESTKNFLSFDDGSKLFDKGLDATEKDHNDARKDAEKVNPFYNDRLKWEEEKKREEKGEKPKGFFDKVITPIKDKLRLNNNTYEDILYKKNEDITEQEINNVRKYTWYESKDKNLNQKLNNRVSSWYDNVYGTKRSLDATGKTISPLAKNNIKKESIPLKTHDGYNIDSAFDKVAEVVGKKENGSKFLQTKLNDYDLNPKLKVDGDIGTKTTSGLKYAVANYGLNDVLKRLNS